MESLLQAWQDLGKKQGAKADYLFGLSRAEELLPSVKDVTSLISELRKRGI